MKNNIYRFGIWYKYLIFDIISPLFMSEEVLGISVEIDQHFDIKFNLIGGIFSAIARLLGI